MTRYDYIHNRRPADSLGSSRGESLRRDASLPRGDSLPRGHPAPRADNVPMDRLNPTQGDRVSEESLHENNNNNNNAAS